MSGLEIWRNLHLRTKGLIVIAVPATATVLIACAAYVLGSRVVATEQAIQHIQETSQAIQRLKISEAEVSANIRAYFSSGEEAFENEAREQMAAFDVTLQRLSFTADTALEALQISQIAKLERSRVEGIIAASARLQSGAFGKKAWPTWLGTKEAERLQIESILAKMFEDQQRLLEIQSSEAGELHTQLRVATGACAIFGVVGGVVISLLFASGITNRIQELQTNVSRLATGGELALLAEGRDEIGGLNAGITKAAEILRRRTGALENAPYGIAHADETGRYLSFNKAYARIACLSEGDRTSVAVTVQQDDRAKVEAAIQLMRSNGQGETEVRIADCSGTFVDVAMTFQPLSADSKGGYYIFLRDITLRKQTEDALVRAKDAALASSLAKNDFLAKISHDIRTPLNAILGAANLLSETTLSLDQSEYVHMFQRNCARLVVLINDFLDFSKIEAGALRLEKVPFRIRETVEDAVATFRELASRKGVDLSTEIAPDVPDWELGDPLRVQQVIVNLLSNAIKFTEAGQVSVAVSKTAMDGADRLRFEISDTGPGIAPDDQERIFAAFTQLSKPAPNRAAGCGLGLAICRELVGRMGGEIGLSSELGRGSRFHFTFPLEAAQPRDAAGIAALPKPQLGGSGTVRLLVAEDTEDNRLLLKHYLRGEPLEVRFASDGQEAVDAVTAGAKFDLILMDLDMPGMDGYEATRFIREWEKSQGEIPTPIVALSAHAMRDAEQACLAAGCSAHVAKPVDRATLLGAIRRYARSSNFQKPADNAMDAAIAALVPKYLASKPKQIEEALAALAVREFEPIRRFGHNLKGTGRGYGFPALEEMGREIEMAAKNGDEVSIAEQLQNLHNFVTCVPAGEGAAS